MALLYLTAVFDLLSSNSLRSKPSNSLVRESWLELTEIACSGEQIPEVFLSRSRLSIHSQWLCGPFEREEEDVDQIGLK